jgi:hypothetical protein
MMILNIVKFRDAKLIACPRVIKQAVIIRDRTANRRGRNSIISPMRDVKINPILFILLMIPYERLCHPFC